jgi:hypothetical protein
VAQLTSFSIQRDQHAPEDFEQDDQADQRGADHDVQAGAADTCLAARNGAGERTDPKREQRERGPEQRKQREAVLARIVPVLDRAEAL